MNRYRRMKTRHIPRFERLGDYLIIVQPDSVGACITMCCMMNPQ